MSCNKKISSTTIPSVWGLEFWTTFARYICIYIYVCVCVCLFGPVKLESGIIPSGQKSFNYEHLNFPGKELNVTDITEQ